MKKFLNTVMKINFKKVGIRFIIVGIIVLLVSGITCFLNFQSRISGWKQQIETIVDSERFDNSTASDENSIGKYNESSNELNRKNYIENQNKEKNEFSRDNENGCYFGNRINDNIDLDQILNLTTKDKIILAAVFIIFALTAVTYWILIALWMIKRAGSDGADYVLFGLLALAFNLLAVLAYYIYRAYTLRCPECRKIQKKGSDFCKDCGTPLNKTCSSCNEKVGINDKYCHKCSKKQ